MIPRSHGGNRNENPFKTNSRKKITKLKRSSPSSCRLCLFPSILIILIFQLWSTTFFDRTAAIEPSPLASSENNVLEAAAQTERQLEMPKIFKAKTSREKEALNSERQTFQKVKEKLKRCRLGIDCRLDQKILIRNTIPENRFWCNHDIKGNGGVLILNKYPDECSGGGAHSHLFSEKPPTLSGRGTLPIELFWDFGSNRWNGDKSLRTSKFSCSVPCRSNKDQSDSSVLSVISVKGTNWEITSTMEGEKYFPEAKIDPKAYQRDKYFAVTSFQSEIPMPYFSWAEYKINNPAINFDRAIKGALFLAKNCNSKSDRESVVQALLKTKLRVDSPSGCFNNAGPPPGLKDLSNSTALQERYLFYLAFENQQTNDYVTEKLWGALRAGTLPVYFGAPNIREHVPANSVVFVDDFKTTQDLANYLISLTKDKELYESYHAWRYTNNDDKKFLQKYQFTDTHSTCRMCKWAFAKRHGLAFDHFSQEIREPQIPHMTCRNRMGLIGHPFKEYWLSAKTGKEVRVESKVNTKTCILDDLNRVLTIDNGVYQRQVYDTDGITDLVIDGGGEDKNSAYLLQLKTPVKSSNLIKIEGQQEYWLQDSVSRLVVLTSKPMHIFLEKAGSLKIPVDSPIRIRMIYEDVDQFHAKAWKYSNYFGSLMTRDFFSPLETYNVEP